MSTLGIGGHQSARMGKDEWLTPPALIERLGEFDLDPCSPIVRPWATARASGILFLRGRLHFHHVDGTRADWNGGAPSCLVAYGKSNLDALYQCRLPGQLVTHFER